MRLRWKLDLVDLEIVLILTQDRCMVYAEPTICLEVILDTPKTWVMWNLISVRLETGLDRCTVCAKHTIGLENHLGRTRRYS